MLIYECREYFTHVISYSVMWFQSYNWATVACVITSSDEWITCDFTSFSKLVFQSDQDDGRMVINGCVQWNPVCNWEDFERGSNSGPLDQQASA